VKLFHEPITIEPMKRFLSILLGVMLVAPLFAATETNSAPTTDATEASYTKAIEGRTADILKALALTDEKKSAAVHDIVIAQYRALRTWHDENDAKLKSAKEPVQVSKINASLKTLHNQFIAQLAENLTTEQVDIVKDKMTYGVVQVTYKAYLGEYPDLTEAEKKQILAWLIEARETSMDQGSSAEKHAVFGKYKGRINNYLSKEGYDGKTGKKKVEAPAGMTSTNQPAK
jgi:vancomycin resistance protein YoaR